MVLINFLKKAWTIVLAINFKLQSVIHEKMVGTLDAVTDLPCHTERPTQQQYRQRTDSRSCDIPASDGAGDKSSYAKLIALILWFARQLYKTSVR